MVVVVGWCRCVGCESVDVVLCVGGGAVVVMFQAGVLVVVVVVVAGVGGYVPGCA